MIVDPLSSRTSIMAKDHDDVPQQAPPSYDAVVAGQQVPPQHGPFVLDGKSPEGPPPLPGPTLPRPAAYQQAGASGQFPAPPVYQYVNPATGERVVSLLPPDHPQMVCLQQGSHDTTSKFGVLGILAAVLWFPLGIGLCLLDRKVYCRRCGAIVSDGMC